MDASSPPSGIRVDVWTWAIRLFPTRSAATAACQGGHVKVNGATAKPARIVRVGDSVRAITPGGERIVVVRAIVSRRTSAALAVENYEDQSPAPTPRTDRPAPVSRDRGSGRPTKRERRQVDRLRGRG